MYTEQIKSASVVSNYRRKTYLDKPVDIDAPFFEEIQDFDAIQVQGASDNKLSREEQIDDYDIKAQYVAGAAAEFETHQQ
jgi:hypothetical protein